MQAQKAPPAAKGPSAPRMQAQRTPGLRLARGPHACHVRFACAALKVARSSARATFRFRPCVVLAYAVHGVHGARPMSAPAYVGTSICRPGMRRHRMRRPWRTSVKPDTPALPVHCRLPEAVAIQGLHTPPSKAFPCVSCHARLGACAVLSGRTTCKGGRQTMTAVRSRSVHWQREGRTVQAPSPSCPLT